MGNQGRGKKGNEEEVEKRDEKRTRRRRREKSDFEHKEKRANIIFQDMETPR